MVSSTAVPMRDRLVDEAARLFAERGFAATSVGDIQAACGLTAGSGALYKHFPSKRALLGAVVRRHIRTMATGHGEVTDGLGDDPRAALRLIATSVWSAMQSDRRLLRIILRDLDAFPDLLEEIWQGVLDNLYRAFTSWLILEAERGRVAVDDPAASASVLLASLTCYPILDALIGRVPGDIGKERYIASWVDHAAASLQLRD